MAEELPNLAEAVRKANREVWEQASGRKPRGESDAVPPPTGRESPLEGADASAMVAALSAKLSALQARVDYIEDDFPENGVSGSLAEAQAFAHSLSVATHAGTTITCTGGHWTHRTTVHEIPAKSFWYGAEESIPDGAAQLSAGDIFVYVEIPGNVMEGIYWGVSSSYPESSTTYLRRCIFSITIENIEGVLTPTGPITVRNAGDLFS